ncbi:unnamed protein product [Oppiella nova]|uniref:Centromere protein J C-terminal domain-containing protein n=1 Tax=Oppiella nova TaxID=334625 RepID=A0A7R9QLC8_9ACAR|nr:unnamed protein product [Oppiella nova]CAG2167578.1 unnamed protein product [Oppiella nova]
MHASVNHSIASDTDIWHRIMDQLIELKEWQRTQEEAIKRHQTKQISSLSEQNVKLNALTNTLTTSYHNPSVGPSHPQPSQRQPMDDSLEEFRAAEEECRDASDHSMSFGHKLDNSSYSENSAVIPGIDGKVVKTFEDLLIKRLSGDKVEEMVKTSVETKPKKPFLRKGEGIKRFEPKTSRSSKDSSDQKKRICLKTSIGNTVKPKVFEKRIGNKRKDNTKDEKFVNPKTFNRKVIPMTTKIDKNVKSVVVSRNTPIVINELNESESVLFDCLQQICGNVSLDDHSIDDQFRDKDVYELQELLKKIELKKSGIQRQLSGGNIGYSDVNDRQSGDKERQQRHQLVTKNTGNKDAKKKVHWSPQGMSSGGESEDEMCDFSSPKSGAYSSSLKRQINELEERLSHLKTTKKCDNLLDNKSVDKQSSDVLNPLNSELLKLRQQMEKLNTRIVNIESKSYDLITPQMKEISNNKQKVNIFSKQNGRTLPKTRTSATNGLNISVNESPNDTTINFPNGDKMTVSKDNTIFYIFANGATQTTYADGLKIINFPNGQSEKVHKNGVKHITYANGLQRIINPDGSEEVLMTDGTVWRIHADGSEVLEFANGDREIRTDNYKRREYSNGNIKTLYSDGTEETRYICGRLRIKDRFGNLMVDSMIRHLDQHI